MSDQIPIILISMALSAFFSGIEIAYISANKLRIELMQQKGDVAARVSSFFLKNPSKFMTTTLVGNNIALIMYGVFSAAFLEAMILNNHWISPDNKFLIFVTQTVISSLIVLVVAEFIPKAIFRSNANSLLYILILPFMMFYYLFFPVVKLLDYLSRLILRYVLRLKVEEITQEYTRRDLLTYVETSSDAEKDNEESEVDTQIFKNAVEFHSVQVRECMIPRTELEALEVTCSIEELQEKFKTSGHSKILIYRSSIDDIIGYVHLVDLYKNPVSIDKIVIPILISTESMPASDLLKQFLEKRRSMAVVVDEFGGTAGICTVEDILEEIIGEIDDEHDLEEFTEQIISEHEYIFSARLEIEYLNEKYHLKIPEGDYDTLGGYILGRYGNIPVQNEVIEANPFLFTILKMDKTKLIEVQLKVIDKTE